MDHALTPGNTGTRGTAEPRVIMHLDMDAFFVNVELLANPNLRGTPIIVAPLGARSVVCSASYEARQYGVRSAMPLTRALALCPHAHVLPLEGDYGHYSRSIMSILGDESPLVEQISVDEAFVDLTGAYKHGQNPVDIAQRVRARIADELHLPASAGLAPNKLLAKMASTGSKPNGLWVIPPARVQEFLDPLPVGKLWGVGAKSREKLNSYGVERISQLRECDSNWLVKTFGKAQGEHLYLMARGMDDRPVVTEREEKSMGAEHTFATDTRESEQVLAALLYLSLQIGQRLRARSKRTASLSIKYRYAGFETHTRSVRLDCPTDSGMDLYRAVAAELASLGVADSSAEYTPRALRLVGIAATKLSDQGLDMQTSLFDMDESGAITEQKRQPNWSAVEHAMDTIRQRFGADSVRLAPGIEIKRGE